MFYDKTQVSIVYLSKKNIFEKMSKKRRRTTINETNNTNTESEKEGGEYRSALALFFDGSNSDKKLTGVPAETIPYDLLLDFLDFKSVDAISRVSKAARQTAFHVDNLGDRCLKFRGEVVLGRKPFDCKWKVDRLHHAGIKILKVDANADREGLSNYVLPRCVGLTKLWCCASKNKKSNTNAMKADLTSVLRAIADNATSLRHLTLFGFKFDQADVKRLNVALQRVSLQRLSLNTIVLPKNAVKLKAEDQSFGLLSKNTLVEEVKLRKIDYSADEEQENTAVSVAENGCAYFGTLSTQNLSTMEINGRAFLKGDCGQELEVIRGIVKRADSMTRFLWKDLECWERLETLTPRTFKGLLEDLRHCKKLCEVILPVKNDEHARHICNFLDNSTGITKVKLIVKEPRNEEDGPKNTVDPYKLGERLAKIRKIDRFAFMTDKAHKCRCPYCLPVRLAGFEIDIDSDSL